MIKCRMKIQDQTNFQIDNSKAHAINQVISTIYGRVRDNNILKNTSRVDDEPGELHLSANDT